MEFPFRSVAVLGPGLLGGSLLLAINRLFPDVTLNAWARRKEARDEIGRLDVPVVVAQSAGEAAAAAELVVLATPVPVMAAVAEAAAEGLVHKVVTDVGSVKARPARDVVAVVRRHGGEFVGSHPMAGSEKGGIAHADSLLFTGAACVVAPNVDTEKTAISSVADFWSALGSRVSILDPLRHDAIIARVSHLPHVAASAVAVSALSGDASIAEFIGGGFRDTTRVAAGDPDLWTGILEENAAEVAPLLRLLAAELQDVADILEKTDSVALRSFLDHARQLRQGCPPRERS